MSFIRKTNKPPSTSLQLPQLSPSISLLVVFPSLSSLSFLSSSLFFPSLLFSSLLFSFPFLPFPSFPSHPSPIPSNPHPSLPSLTHPPTTASTNPKSKNPKHPTPINTLTVISVSQPIIQPRTSVGRSVVHFLSSTLSSETPCIHAMPSIPSIHVIHLCMQQASRQQANKQASKRPSPTNKQTDR